MVIIRSLLVVFILYFTRNIEKKPSDQILSDGNELHKKFSLLLEKNYTTRKTVSDYAGILAVSPNYLSEVTRKATGYPPSYHIQQRIVLEAKRLARSSTLRMKEIAVHLGFNDYSHFSKFFKLNTGICFSDYKRIVATEIITIN
ncbi:hypothetical protein Dfri01_46890 [Dyadobacter frigoris]|nr:hypothetical protein Dfri01_46890 [Dyadobacter frigoris]